MSKVFIVCDSNNGFSIGGSLEAAFKNYDKEVGWGEDKEELEVYEAEQIQVEFKVVKKEVPTKVVNKGAK